MVEVDYLVKDIPIVMVYNDLFEAKEKGCILFCHGLTSKKEDNLKELRRIANEGYLVIGIDAYLHGVRKTKESEKDLAEDNPEFPYYFFQVVMHTAKDLSTIIDWLTEQQLIHEERIGLTGISMGGFITYNTIVLEPRIKVAVPVIATPTNDFQSVLPLRHFDQIKMLSIVALQDTVVPPNYTIQFHEDLKDYYKDYENRLGLVSFPNSGHFMKDEDWDSCIETMIAWFNQHI